ncbi:serine O-acetyltransferase [Mycolicibacterium vaccae]|uniref:serine O-acetyltransferase n=1 Tax=Mycolicibacterium vaccae TaxID=1810 RepID=UPI003CF1FCA9
MRVRNRQSLPVAHYSASGLILLEWRLMTRLWRSGRVGRVVARFVRGHIRRTYGCYISPKSEVGRSVYLPHPIGVVIGDNAVISDGVTIYQNVTIGQASDAGVCPRVERNATIYAGAVVIGAVEVGTGSVVGANAVVRTSIPPGALAVGVPARVLERSENTN